MESKMRQAAAKMIRASLATAAVVAGLFMASPQASAQSYFVDGRAASATEVQYLASQGMPAGNWHIDGWGIGPAQIGVTAQLASADASNGKCWYVLDVPLGDCDTSRAIASSDPAPGTLLQTAVHAQLASAEVRQ
jgi:hypothetical protein